MNQKIHIQQLCLALNFEVLNYNPEEPPTFTFTEDYEDIVKVNWNKSFNP